MNLRPIIDDIAGQADELLISVTERMSARTALDKFLALDQSKLVAADRRTVVDHVMAILENDNFFAERYVDSFDAEQDQESGGDED